MLDAAIGQIAGQLNQALRGAFQVSEDLVAVTNLVDVDGRVPLSANNKLVVFLTNVERETVADQGTRTAAGAGRDAIARSAPALHLNLMLMFVANFGGGNYAEALKFISATIAFFQGHALFDHQNSPDLDPRIERLALDIENLGIADLSNLWGILGGKYLPSILYRVRMITFDSAQITGRLPRIVRAGAEVAA